MKVNAIIECTSDGLYCIFTLESFEKFGLHGYGKTPDEAIEDFWLSYREVQAEFGADVPPIEVTFSYDVSAFLHLCKNLLTQSGLSRLTGINSKQISHYLTGYRNPSPKTVKKIEEAVHAFADELQSIRLVTVKANGDVVE